MFKSNSGEPYAGKLHVRFLEEFISNCLKSKEGGKFTYAYPDCTVRYTKKSGGMKTLSNYKHNTKWMVKINKKEVNAARIFAKAFIKKDLDSNDCVLVYGKELKLDAIDVVDRSKCASITGSLASSRYERKKSDYINMVYWLDLGHRAEQLLKIYFAAIKLF